MVEVAKGPLRTSATIAAVLYVVAAFVLYQGIFALVLFAVVVLYFLPATLWALRTDRRVAKMRAAKMGVYLLAAVSITVTMQLQNSLADGTAVKLGEACLAYRVKYHHYPKDLEGLVPEFISSVPQARYGLTYDGFFYIPRENDEEPMLFYEAVPPFGRKFYHIESRSWGYLD